MYFATCFMLICIAWCTE